jgi:stearoyl-CoA desaturase (delta-9 desaturase)
MTARADDRPVYTLSNINWITAVAMGLFHVAAIAALFFVSWTNVLTAVVVHWFAVGFGISLGYHRLHTHRGYKTSKAFEYFLAVCGTLTLEGGPLFWVATLCPRLATTLGSARGRARGRACRHWR